MSDKKEFTGVFTPKCIFTLPLTWFQKYVFSSIVYLDNEEGCTASNSTLAEKLCSNKEQVSKAIKAIEKTGLISVKITGPKNNQRRIIRIVKTTFRKMTKQHLENVKKAFSQSQNDISQNVKMTTNIKVDNSTVDKTVDIIEEEKISKEDFNEPLNAEKEESKKEKNSGKKEKERFGKVVVSSIEMHKVLVDIRPDLYTPEPMQGDLKELTQLSYKIKKEIIAQKKRDNEFVLDCTNEEIVENFRAFCYALPEWNKLNTFDTSYLNNKFHVLVKKVKNKDKETFNKSGNEQRDKLDSMYEKIKNSNVGF